MEKEKEPKKNSFFVGFINLFFNELFMYHRLIGLTYLLMYASFIILYFYDYKKWYGSIIFICTPLFQLLQSITATATFTFLPREKDSGFFSDKG
jgi:hypothetical protein